MHTLGILPSEFEAGERELLSSFVLPVAVWLWHQRGRFVIRVWRLFFTLRIGRTLLLLKSSGVGERPYKTVKPFGFRFCCFCSHCTRVYSALRLDLHR